MKNLTAGLIKPPQDLVNRCIDIFATIGVKVAIEKHTDKIQDLQEILEECIFFASRPEGRLPSIDIANSMVATGKKINFSGKDSYYSAVREFTGILRPAGIGRLELPTVSFSKEGIFVKGVLYSKEEYAEWAHEQDILFDGVFEECSSTLANLEQMIDKVKQIPEKTFVTLSNFGDSKFKELSQIYGSLILDTDELENAIGLYNPTFQKISLAKGLFNIALNKKTTLSLIKQYFADSHIIKQTIKHELSHMMQDIYAQKQYSVPKKPTTFAETNQLNKKIRDKTVSFTGERKAIDFLLQKINSLRSELKTKPSEDRKTEINKEIEDLQEKAKVVKDLYKKIDPNSSFQETSKILEQANIAAGMPEISVSVNHHERGIEFLPRLADHIAYVESNFKRYVPIEIIGAIIKGDDKTVGTWFEKLANLPTDFEKAIKHDKELANNLLKPIAQLGSKDEQIIYLYDLLSRAVDEGRISEKDLKTTKSMINEYFDSFRALYAAIRSAPDGEDVLEAYRKNLSPIGRERFKKIATEMWIQLNKYIESNFRNE